VTAAAPFRFWLGTHRPNWLSRPEVDVPLFVSHVTLGKYRRALPVATHEWACDSGSFSEVLRHGSDAFPGGHPPYIAALRRYRDEIGQMCWAAPQDWMCESWMIAKTGLSIAEHQRRTVANAVAIRSDAPDLPVIVVLQGDSPEDYERCAALYEREGFDLAAEPLVGLGSVCRRQHLGGIYGLVIDLFISGIRLHGFGISKRGLPRLYEFLASADSMAWSYDARARRVEGHLDEAGKPIRGVPLPECKGKHRGSCANCPRYAMKWRAELLDSLPTQLTLWSAA
jgi:hypothetical protein